MPADAGFRMSDRTLIGIASIPERAGSLERVVAALAPQADRVHVALNEYTHVPAFLREYLNVTWDLLDDVNLGDAEKFRAVDDWDGIFLTCDDDILYPPDYVANMLAGLERHPGRAVGHHGGTTYGWNGSEVAASHKRRRCLDREPEDDEQINVLGTGAMAFRTRDVPVWRSAFGSPNMADVWFAILCRRLGVKMATLAHPRGWLRDICPPVGEGRRIYDSNRAQDGSKLDTTIVREREIRRLDWLAPAPGRPRVHVSVTTCERPELLLDLLGDLEREATWVDLSVSVFEDGSDADYAEALEVCARHDWTWHSFAERQGREGYWRLVEAEFEACRRSDAEWFLFLPDDVRLVRHAIARAILIWHRLDDPAALTLWRLESLEGKANWTGVTPIDGEEAAESFHVDGLYLCQRATLAALQFRVGFVRSRTSSGVGSKLSRRLHELGKRMYRVNESLALPVDCESVMNGEERLRHPSRLVA